MPKKTVEVKVASFSEPIYCSEHEVYYGDVENIEKWYSKEYNCPFNFPEVQGQALKAGAFTFYDPNRGKYVMVYSKRPSPDIVAHECGHAAKMVLGHIGYTAEAGNDEPEAYFQSFLVRMVGECRAQHREKDKREKSVQKKKSKKT